ncbi:MAG: RING finger protein [Candidatus Xenobia bacterium]
MFCLRCCTRENRTEPTCPVCGTALLDAEGRALYSSQLRQLLEQYEAATLPAQDVQNSLQFLLVIVQQLEQTMQWFEAEATKAGLLELARTALGQPMSALREGMGTLAGGALYLREYLNTKDARFRELGMTQVQRGEQGLSQSMEVTQLLVQQLKRGGPENQTA